MSCRHMSVRVVRGHDRRYELQRPGRPQAPSRADGGRTIVAVSEVAKGKAVPRQGAAEALVVCAIDVEARLEGQTAKRSAIGLAFDLQRSRRQGDIARLAGAANLDAARDGAVAVNAAGPTGAVEAIESKKLARDEVARRIGRKRFRRRQSRRNKHCSDDRETYKHRELPLFSFRGRSLCLSRVPAIQLAS